MLFKGCFNTRLKSAIIRFIFFYLVMRLLQGGQNMQCLLRIGFQVIVHQVVDKHRPTVCQFGTARKKPKNILNTLKMKHLLQ